MSKFSLTKDEIYQFVSTNKYELETSHQNTVRCFDGVLSDDSNQEAPVVFGGTIGEIALIVAMANTYGLEIDYEKLPKIYAETVSFHIHTGTDFFASDCAHLNQMYADPKTYGIGAEDREIINSLSGKLEKNSEKLSHEHRAVEGAVLFVNGKYGIHPRFEIEIEGKLRTLNVLVYHLTHAQERYKKISKSLIENKIVTLYNDLGEEYLYDALLETQDIHIYETIKQVATNLPLFEVTFKDDGAFSVENLGNVQGTYEFENQTH